MVFFEISFGVCLFSRSDCVVYLCDLACDYSPAIAASSIFEVGNLRFGGSLYRFRFCGHIFLDKAPVSLERSDLRAAGDLGSAAVFRC